MLRAPTPCVPCQSSASVCTGSCIRTYARLLWLLAPWVGDEEGTVVGDEGLLDLVLALLVHVLLVVGDDGLGDGLSERVHLADVTTSPNRAPDVDAGKLVEADDEDRFVDLCPQDLGLDELDRRAVDLDQTLARPAVGDRGRRLLLAEAYIFTSVSVYHFDHHKSDLPIGIRSLDQPQPAAPHRAFESCASWRITLDLMRLRLGYYRGKRGLALIAGGVTYTVPLQP